MDYAKFWDENVSLHNFLEEYKCLCRYGKNPKSFLEFSKACFEESNGENENCQLLCISVLRLLAETYVAEINKYKRICKEMQTFFTMMCKEEMFYYMVDQYLTVSNQHLSWSFAKTLSAVVYGTQLCVTKEWINFIVKNLLLQASEDKCFRLIELLSYFICPVLKTSDYKNDDSKCQNITHSTLPLPKDHFICICSELAPYWKKMVEIYSSSDSKEVKKEIAFLHLWKLIIDGPLQDELSLVYLDKKFILDILCQGNLNRLKVVSLYVEVIIKITCSNLKCRPWDEDDCMLIEKSVTATLSSCLLESLPTNDQEFCNVIKKTSSCGSLNMSNGVREKFGAVEKKIIFILMSLLAEFRNMELLCESYQKIIAFINQNNMLVPLWLVNLFLDDDDLLFGVMLASIRIYKNLRNEKDIRIKRCPIELFLLHDINPHALFIQCLQFLGYDHNELISFLVSDETCCLLYLTEYLKLLLCEKQEFIKTYLMMKSDKVNIAREENYPSTADQTQSCSEKAQLDSSSDKDCITSALKRVNSDTNIEINGEEEILKNNCPLVAYSSSSSEEEICDEKESEVENLLKIVSVLINLREGIQKLVDIKEFPYNITPLLILLKSCEDLFR